LLRGGVRRLDHERKEEGKSFLLGNKEEKEGRKTMALNRTEEAVVGVVHGWYDPFKSQTLGNVCVAEGCGLPAAYHLCPEHAVPGAVIEVLPGKLFVISSWFAERKGNHFLLHLNDWALGVDFGNRKQFEERLISDGYTHVRLMPTLEDTRTVFLRYPRVIGISCG
jgi:hypothetical protein